MSVPAPLLTVDSGRLLRAGRDHRILAGAIHPFRVHPTSWEDRIARLVALGANTLDLYVAWNVHQPRRDVAPDFEGWRDLGRFIDLAGEAGLDVIARPGPYICAEWDNGGLPAWLGSTGLRSRDPDYQAAVEDWFDVLIPIIAERQAAHGGPVVAVQIENEYGSFSDDHEYMAWHRDLLLDRGIVEQVFTADGGSDFYLDGGALPDVWAASTLGSRGPQAIETWQRRRPGEHFLTIEFWCGWFDHWGEEHHVRPAEDAAADIAAILDRGGSVCLYMAHGGTNFGLRAGANYDRGLQPTVTSYDYDAPIAEDGTLTEKFHAVRREFYRARGEAPPPLPEHLTRPTPTLAPRSLALPPGPDVLEIVRSLPVTAASLEPLTFNQLDVDTGLVLYGSDVVLPGTPAEPEEALLSLPGLADRAHIWIDGQRIGVLDDRTCEDGITVSGTGSAQRIRILVENLGRINYGHRLGADKGILGGVLINQRKTSSWTQTVIDLENWGPEDLTRLPSTRFDVESPADTHVEMTGFGKGFVWINGFLLGRYWDRGPQRTLYLPAGLLRAGANVLHVLELERPGTHVELRARPDLGEPANRTA